MPLPSEVENSPVSEVSTAGARSQGWSDKLEIWNRKIHYYSGLYLLLFIWLFSFTGLVLNHQWEIHNFWAKRHESTFTQKIVPPTETGMVEQADDLIRQLHIRGEVTISSSKPNPGVLDFRVFKPGLLSDIQVDLVKQQATVHQIRINTWGFLESLHTFTGVKRTDPNAQRNWVITKMWSFWMDAVALGLIVMVLGSYYMWYRLKRKNHLLGWITLAAGFALCGFFVVGLAWLYPMR